MPEPAPQPFRPRDLSAVSLAAVFGVATTLAAIVLIAPSIVILITSFTDSASLKFPPSGYSLRWYRALADADQMQTAALNSLIVALWTTVISIVLGTGAAVAVSRGKGWVSKLLDGLFMSPLLLPALAFGFAALIFIYRIGLRPNLALLVLGHVIVCVPFVIRTTLASLAQLDPALADASLSLGATHSETFRRITLPLIGRGIGAGGFLAFMASFDNVPVSLFLADERTEVLPIHLWQQIETNLDVRTAAASGVIIVATLILMTLAERFAGLTSQMR